MQNFLRGNNKIFLEGDNNMKQQFINKNLCFLGDSHTARGRYVYYLRAAMQGAKEKCYVFNCGASGARSETGQYTLLQELEGRKPDYVFVMFGVNDMGIWLYDGDKEVTAELLAKRAERDQRFQSGICEIVKTLKAKGITPVLMSTVCVNERLIEKENIQTVADNQEKEDYIGPSFYKRKTFRAINVGLKGYAAWVKAFAEAQGVEYIDNFTPSYENTLNADDTHLEDGIHLSDAGYHAVAKNILAFLGVENLPETLPQTPENDEIFTLEGKERAIQFIPWVLCNPVLGERTDADVIKYCEDMIADPKKEDWMKNNARFYLENCDKQMGYRAELEKMTYEL